MTGKRRTGPRVRPPALPAARLLAAWDDAAPPPPPPPPPRQRGSTVQMVDSKDWTITLRYGPDGGRHLPFENPGALRDLIRRINRRGQAATAADARAYADEIYEANA